MGWYVQLVPSRRWRFALGFAVLGAALEGVQALVGYRSAELTDLLADCIGVGLGWHVSAAWLPGALLRLDRALATLAG